MYQKCRPKRCVHCGRPFENPNNFVACIECDGDLDSGENHLPEDNLKQMPWNSQGFEPQDLVFIFDHQLQPQRGGGFALSPVYD